MFPVLESKIVVSYDHFDLVEAMCALCKSLPESFKRDRTMTLMDSEIFSMTTDGAQHLADLIRRDVAVLDPPDKATK